MTEWSPQQALALQRVNRWLETGDSPVFQLAGFAGTGKTTLAKHLAAGVKGRV
jgi:exodeoxyribonuclease-5